MPQRYPFYFKLCLVLLMLVLIGGILFIGQDILLPLLFSIVFAILLVPVSNLMQRIGIPRVGAMLLTILLALSFFGALVYFLSAQVASFLEDVPTIKKNLNAHINSLQKWVRQSFNISVREQDKMVSEATGNLKDSGTGVLGNTVFTAASFLFTCILLPLYTFLIMFYKDLIKKFLLDVFDTSHKSKVQEVLSESRTIIQSYMVGLLIEMAIVTGLNAAGFFIIGIKYAIFLAVLSAILNMIPYIGMLIASVICMVITLTTSNNLSDIIWVGAVLVFVQFLDNNIIMPYVVSSKVRINALVSILGVLIGGSIAGIGGMFLSIPGIAILKVIFDRVDDLKPWGMLMGDDYVKLKPRIHKRLGKKAPIKK
ncbi:MAG: AI-2E family transporter [Gemmatimonadaceae bacterium]|nr:AI-2E family transporter [Chitinophagaceae bacterium]